MWNLRILVVKRMQDLIQINHADELLFAENESNEQRLWGVPSPTQFVKDSINDYVVNGNKNAVNPARVGTKAAAIYKIDIRPGEARTIRLRLKQIAKGEKSCIRA